MAYGSSPFGEGAEYKFESSNANHRSFSVLASLPLTRRARSEGRPKTTELFSSEGEKVLDPINTKPELSPALLVW